MKRTWIAWSAAAVVGLAPWSRAAHYGIDPAHSEVSFKVKHLMISKVQGRFDKFAGEFDYDEKAPQRAQASASIEASSINTGNEKRDQHLKSADFFEADKYPTITFRSTKVVPAEGGKAKLEGLLKMHGVEKPVALDLDFNGTVKDPWGTLRAGFEATGRINRKDFGINWSKAMDNGGAVVGDEVEIAIRIEGVAKDEGGPQPVEKKMEQQNKMEQKPAGGKK